MKEAHFSNFVFYLPSSASYFDVNWKLCLYRDIRSTYRIQRPSGLRRGSVANRSLVLRVRILPGYWISVSCVCCVLSGRCLCDELIACPEESECGLSEYDLEALTMRRPGSIRAAEPLGGGGGGGGGGYSRTPLIRFNWDDELPDMQKIRIIGFFFENRLH